MSEIERIYQQMEQGFAGDAWHGPPLMEILDGVDARTAAAKPIPGAHSIWEIVLHLTGTQKVLLRRLRGDPHELTPEEDWPPVPEPTEAAWRETIDLLRQQEKQFRRVIGGFPDDQLDRPLNPGGSSAYNNFHGHVQHNLYHAGQIMLLKKAVVS